MDPTGTSCAFATCPFPVICAEGLVSVFFTSRKAGGFFAVRNCSSLVGLATAQGCHGRLRRRAEPLQYYPCTQKKRKSAPAYISKG